MLHRSKQGKKIENSPGAFKHPKRIAPSQKRSLFCKEGLLQILRFRQEKHGLSSKTASQKVWICTICSNSVIAFLINVETNPCCAEIIHRIGNSSFSWLGKCLNCLFMGLSDPLQVNVLSRIHVKIKFIAIMLYFQSGGLSLRWLGSQFSSYRFL